jgi:hypothetical protein
MEALRQLEPIPAAVAYFFCKDLEGMSPAYDIMRALSCQLSSCSDRVRVEVKRVWNENRGVATLSAPIDVVFQSLIERPLQAASNLPKLLYSMRSTSVLNPRYLK